MRRVLIGFAGLALLLVAVPALAGGQSELAEARQATAAFHRVANAERAGYASTLGDLGCFENPGVGGMGLHYLSGEFLMDGVPNAAEPEALVYEMREDGQLKLVALEYIVPTDLWSGIRPPSLYGREFHRHPVLPLWVMHAWIWKPNPLGMFQDWNPRVDMCPEGVKIFGEE